MTGRRLARFARVGEDVWWAISVLLSRAPSLPWQLVVYLRVYKAAQQVTYDWIDLGHGPS
jgi:hypothetical protein